MTLEVLVAAMEEKPKELIDKMNLNSDGVIINQKEKFGYEEIKQGNNTICLYEFKEKGVGLSRNTALMIAKGDIVLFSDSDIIYEKSYARKILQAFEENPKADIILFNFKVSQERRTYYILKKGRVYWYNCGRYPAYSIAAKREVLIKHNLTFSLLFGGGAKYSAGEDSLFLRQCLKKKLKIVKLPILLGVETPGESTWFHGFNEKFFYDRGVLYHHLYGKLGWLMGLRFVFMKRKTMCIEIEWKRAFSIMKAGMKEAK